MAKKDMVVGAMQGLKAAGHIVPCHEAEKCLMALGLFSDFLPFHSVLAVRWHCSYSGCILLP